MGNLDLNPHPKKLHCHANNSKTSFSSVGRIQHIHTFVSLPPGEATTTKGASFALALETTLFFFH